MQRRLDSQDRAHDGFDIVVAAAHVGQVGEAQHNPDPAKPGYLYNTMASTRNTTASGTVIAEHIFCSAHLLSTKIVHTLVSIAARPNIMAATSLKSPAWSSGGLGGTYRLISWGLRGSPVICRGRLPP